MGQTRKNSSSEMKSNFAQGHFNFSPSDSASIYSIASLCPALGGKAVYKARSLYVLLNDTLYFDDDSLCVSQSVMFRLQENQNQSQVLKALAKVYLNPKTDILNLAFQKVSDTW